MPLSVHPLVPCSPGPLALAAHCIWADPGLPEVGGMVWPSLWWPQYRPQDALLHAFWRMDLTVSHADRKTSGSGHLGRLGESRFEIQNLVGPLNHSSGLDPSFSSTLPTPWSPWPGEREDQLWSLPLWFPAAWKSRCRVSSPGSRCCLCGFLSSSSCHLLPELLTQPCFMSV